MATIWSKDLSTKNRHYEFEIRQTPKTKEPYLTITETSILAGRRQRVAIIISHQDAENFLKALQDTVSHLS